MAKWKRMKGGALWRISVTSPAEAEEAITALLDRTFQTPVSSYFDLDRGVTTATVYFEKKPAWSGKLRSLLAAGIQRIGKCGVRVNPVTISFRKLKASDWEESWKRHFRPIEIGSALLVKPSWSWRRPRKGQAVVVLDPGLSFGTGQHPTTAFCLRQLVVQRRAGEARSFLDMGTGSGILAIAAAKLGYAPVHAFDFDPEAVRLAKANVIGNGAGDRIRLTRRDVTKLPIAPERKFSLICANLVSNLLVAERERIVARLEPGGTLVLAGILRQEFAAVEAAYNATGLRLADSRVEGEWRSGAFVRRRG